jgi:hypothetical protein
MKIGAQMISATRPAPMGLPPYRQMSRPWMRSAATPLATTPINANNAALVSFTRPPYRAHRRWRHALTSPGISAGNRGGF